MYTVTNLTPPPGKCKGCLPRVSEFGTVCPVVKDYPEAIPIIPQREWAGIIEARKEASLSVRSIVPEILDQGGVGSCASEEATQAVMTLRAFSGYSHVPLNPWSLYAWTSGGRDNGSSIDENWQRARDVGIMPMLVWGRDQGWKTKPSQESLINHASNFRLDEFYDIDNTEEMVSALLAGFVVGYGRDGHAILAVDMLDEDHMLYANSWGDWGDAGFGIDKITNVRWEYGAFAARSVLDSSDGGM